MVGALADWFAVTALFRHPLGLPIPHTAIIKRKKDQLGASLSNFVGQNFLAPEVVSAKVASAQIPLRLGSGWRSRRHAARVAAETSTILRGACRGAARRGRAADHRHTIVRRLAEPQWGPPIGQVLAELLAENRQLPLLDLLAERAHQWALGSQETIDRIVARDSPQLVAEVRRLHARREDLQGTRRVHLEGPLQPRARGAAWPPTASWSISPTICRTIRRHDQEGREDQGRDHGSRGDHRARRGDVEGRQAADHGVRRRPEQHAAHEGRRERRQHLGERLRDDAELRAKVDGWVAGRRAVRRGELRRRDHRRSSPTPSRAGTPRRRARRSSCRSAGICSSSGSMAPWSVRSRDW